MPDTQTDHFAAYPSAVVYATPERKTAVKQLLWGDFVNVTGPAQNGWLPVKRGENNYWMEETEVQENRILEVIFVDIGQGDGCLVVTPEDKHILIDAGAGDNYARFLSWRYGRFDKPFVFEAAVISHPDADHYAGFRKVFDKPNVSVTTVYHNGIIERGSVARKDSLGARVKDGNKSFLTDVVRDKAQLTNLLADPAVSKDKDYPTMLRAALQSGRVADMRQLCATDKFMPGYEAGKELSLEVLGPIVEPDANGQARLRWFGDVGKTKNGHSVVLRLRYKKIKILLGGDLNIESENLLLSNYTGLAMPPKNAEAERLIIESAQKIFGADIAKSCHHGSADFTELFLQSVNPIATVISSGDNEPHAHPRAETLGATGKFSRGARPLIFSTELARSANETISNPNLVKQAYRAAMAEFEAATTTAAKDKARKKLDQLIDGIERSIGTFGAINVRTDGEKVVLAYKIERPGKKNRQWDIYRLEHTSPTAEGILRYVPKHEEDD